jgi:MYXO-CTERM domain-containing protein
LQVRVTVVAPPTCADGVGEAWSCQGEDRVRCELGVVVREPCAHGCEPGPGDATCAAAPVDADGDGVPSDLDCDDARDDVYPGAPEVCGDGVDQDCDGRDCSDGVVVGDGGAVGPDAGVGGYRPGAALSSGCAAAPGAGRGQWAALGLGLALVLVLGRWRRRR